MAGTREIAQENGKKGGRPKGSTTKPRISDYLTEKKVEGLVQKAYEMASIGDTVMLKFVLEQHFGKAPQAVDLTTGGEAISITVPPEVAGAFGINATDSKTSGGDKE